ncbi:hypothetical protein BC939DRAFT_496312 [Gamsiella multidivaricata]|uniref:uncharacterized protein n=1 Tax=Gamsiella multidivaricata TaxID=101098 RepID=UPI0022201F19|nr:uncharacterized protein BC939DRAFT_496312 [Gamsiella multidivaricata]KAG0367179.1 hypothetical protein BGZ54_004294 [Gamsiella multidivaricata]KAI7817929.1 hypothetical protein BC939DRAFT_496312 [Gamsiella multidivaricata]
MSSTNTQTTNASISTFTSALLFNAAVGAGVFVAFSIVRHWNKKVYQPRTYLVSENVRSPELPKGPLSWISASFSVPDHVLVERIGLDAYMFLRFLRMAAILFSGFSLLAIPILIPLNVINSGNATGQDTNGTNDTVATGLDTMTLANVKASWRLWFHLVLTILFCGATIAMLWKEMQEYTRRRHAYLMSEKHAKTPQSTTILVTAIPSELETEESLYNIFNRFPGGVRSIWLNRDPKKLAALCKERDATAIKLETAEYNYIRSAYGQKNKKDPEVKEPQRPIGRTSSIPFVGPKVDLIDFYTKRLSELNHEIETLRQGGSPTSLNSAFIRFHTQFGAHSAVQTVVHPTPFRMAPMYVEVSPLDVVWDNMSLDTINKKGRTFISLAAATALILLWSFPVLFVSGIANIDALIKLLPFLSFLKSLPTKVLGIIQGILPPLFLAILMALLPVVLTMMSTFEGHVRHSDITLALMSKYFFFLIVNVLLLSTLSGGIINMFKELNEGNFSFTQIVNILAGSLPKASTFFVTYALLQGLTGPMMELLQIAPFILNILFTKLLAKSPRQIWNVQGRLNSVNYGILFPQMILMFCIGILYSTLAPLILPFVTFFFTMFYFVYRHQFLYVYMQPVETGGLAFPLAVKQVYAGIFIFEVTVFGIFLGKKAAMNTTPHLVLLLLLIVATAISLVNLKQAYNPLITYLPVALFSKDLEMDKNGIVKNNGSRSALTVAVQDEEAAIGEKGEKGSVVALDTFPAGRQDRYTEKPSMLGVGKQEYDETAEVSSCMPAVPTPNPSEIDAASFTRHSLHPSMHPSADVRRDRPVSFVASTHEDVAAQSIHEDEDPELRRLQEQAYCHPAIYSQQTPIWLPVDERGLVSQESSRLANEGIIVATTGAGLDPLTAKANVSGIVYAPGEETRYRLERGM